MRLKQQDYINEIGSLLAKYSAGNGSVLSYTPLQDLKRIYAYITDTPRVTPIGVLLTEEKAARVVGKTLSLGGDLKLAMRVDIKDNRFDLISESLKKTGTVFSPSDLKDISDENALRFSALLHAEEIIFEKFYYHDDVKNGSVQHLYRYIEENPTQASRIIGIAKERYSLDVGLIKGMLDANVPALETGIL